MHLRLLYAARVLFAALLGFTLFSALQPGSGQIGGLSDKIVHFLAFYTLALSAACAAPGMPLAGVAAGLLVFGLAIEGLQVLPAIGRSASLLDLVADAAGIAAALGPVVVLRWRRSFAGNAADGQGLRERRKVSA